MAGFLLFFLYTTTKGRTEAQWTALLSIPLVYLTYRAARRHPAWYRGLLRMCYLTIGLLLVGRLLLLSPREWLPFAKPFDHQPWVERLAEIAGDRPVVVENSYRLASLYEFYSGGKPGYTFTNVEYRPSQYDLWRGDTAFHDRSVMVLGQPSWNTPDYRFFRTQAKDRPMHLRPIDRFQVAKQVTTHRHHSPTRSSAANRALPPAVGSAHGPAGSPGHGAAAGPVRHPAVPGWSPGILAPTVPVHSPTTGRRTHRAV